ncbi:MAG: hypothetical protein JXJ04_08070 [Spirochaetales bacterium]|nr:hypothetical protein [Spirochaetales bacterium]
MRFNDTHYIIAYRLLCEPDKLWTSLDFPHCHRPAIINFFNFLIEQGVLYREHSRGRNSSTRLVNPEKLLNLCIQNFGNHEEKVISFVSKRAETDLIKDLLAANIEFYPGRFSGIRKELIHSTVSGFCLLLPERSLFYGEKLSEFQMDFKVLKVSFGGNITIILPRYKKFLRRYAVSGDSMLYPSDFYTYLFLSVTENIMALPQKNYMEKQLGGVDGNFLAWR